MIRVLFYGSRDWTDSDVIHRDLEALAASLPDGEQLAVIHGCADGADRIAQIWAESDPRAEQWSFPAYWDSCSTKCPVGHRRVNRGGEEYCPTAGHRRNQRMLDQGRPEMAFGYDLGTSGTADMTRRLRAAGIEPTIRTSDQGAET